ncbi:phosphoglycerate mutase-like protein [Microstroma glucosiphilum]|uniref:Phosphoglycerate mutase-like protein n=1 Tax=Pseudomicrostroma glucosiphilum TaxID=1684307 RepID=A0A316U321_9BASI|nr:phosphoglycerate mutase-like protein [Pseudomicrostroma glucosiphilum]PWN19637.1 phosphoglycerate mutase-like protein [Pseudomicrostroma glucosiphilum]
MRVPSAITFLPLLLVPNEHAAAKTTQNSQLSVGGPDGNDVLNSALPEDVFHNLGQYSARYTVEGLPDELPEGCTVTLVNSLERHGVRYMTAGALKSAEATIEKVQTALANTSAPRLPEELRFLKGVNISNHTADLAPMGALQAYYSGKYTRERYSKLASTAEAFIRTSGDPDADRVIVTSQFWSMGYHGEPFPEGPLTDGSSVRAAGAEAKVQPNVIISEQNGSNNTLNVDTCPADTEYGDVAGEDLATSTYGNSTLVPTIGARLGRAFGQAGVSLSLSSTDLANSLGLCSFDTLATGPVSSGHLNLTISPFCTLFTPEEFQMYEYYLDVGKYYGSGYGDPYHEALGVSYLRELLARLTGTEVDLASPTGALNTTLDAHGANSTFPIPPKDAVQPLSGVRIFHDASHDNNISPIVASFGLFRTAPLPLGRHAERSQRAKNRSWHFSRIAPLQGKVVWEKVSCPVKKTSKREHEFVRIRANEAIQTSAGQAWCPGKLAGEEMQYARYGLCPLEKVVRGLQWDRCYEPAVTGLTPQR